MCLCFIQILERTLQYLMMKKKKKKIKVVKKHFDICFTVIELCRYFPKCQNFTAPLYAKLKLIFKTPISIFQFLLRVKSVDQFIQAIVVSLY